MEDRFKFRIPMFSDKGRFCEFQYLELGDWIECSLCGHNGEPQQCTGLKDKNGKLIYEGDILKTSKGNVFVDYDNLNACFGVTNFITVSAFANIFNEEFEIIGNIYQNPELLEIK